MPPPDKKRKRLLEEDLLESKRSRDGARARSPIARSSHQILMMESSTVNDVTIDYIVVVVGISRSRF